METVIGIFNIHLARLWIYKVGIKIDICQFFLLRQPD